MKKAHAIFLSGPVNSGKSTIGAMLASQLREATFIEGDALVKKGGDFEEWVDDTILEGLDRALSLANEGRLPILAFPLRPEDWRVLAAACFGADITPVCITLAPSLEVALSDRGARCLNEQELLRIAGMYKEGYHRREFSALTLDNGAETPGATAQKIAEFLSSLTREKL